MDLQAWATPDGIYKLVSAVLVLVLVLSNVLALLGKKEAAAKLNNAAGELDLARAKADNLTNVAVSIIKGVENAREVLASGDGEKLVGEIQKVTTQFGAEGLVNKVVKAVTEGKGSVDQAVAPESK